MTRTKFIQQILGLVATTSLGQWAWAQPGAKPSLPSTTTDTPMQTVLHPAQTRGAADHGWLQSRHSFSFADYWNPERTQFGALRVLNDDRVAPAKGFGMHPHRDMEIVSIPLAGDLEHRDSMQHTAIIRQGDIQVMSAGTGIRHSEYNHHADRSVEFLQIWIRPQQLGVPPRYDQISIRPLAQANRFYQILSPSAQDQGVWVHQQAWMHLGDFEPGRSDKYTLHTPQHGVYLFVIEGQVQVGTQVLDRRDGYGVWHTSQIELKALTHAQVLLIEVPMTV